MKICRKKERIKKWFIKEREKARSSEMNQVRDYAQRMIENGHRYVVETLKKWVMNLRKLERKVECIPGNDIRR